MTDDDVVGADSADHPAGIDERRRRAIDEALRESVGPTPSSPGIAVRRFGRGCLVVAMAGTFDDAARARLDAVTRDLARLATVELVVCTTHLRGCDQRLARLLSRVRRQHLDEGARVELHDPPPELVAGLREGSRERLARHEENAHRG